MYTRILAHLCGVMTVALCYLLGTYFFNWKAGILAGAYVAIILALTLTMSHIANQAHKPFSGARCMMQISGLLLCTVLLVLTGISWSWLAVGVVSAFVWLSYLTSGRRVKRKLALAHR